MAAAANRPEVSDQQPGGSGTSEPAGRLRTHVVRFAVVGASTTVLHLGMFVVFSHAVTSQLANLGALVLATVVNTYLNRVWTFRRRAGTGNQAREQLQGMLVFLVTWAATAGGLAALAATWPDAGTGIEVLALAACTAVSTAVRFVAMRYWIFAAPARADHAA
ncbi:MAG: GtrA family protein [Dermatophilaceae bacterium]